MPKNPQEVIAYQGKKFTIEWYFDSSGRVETETYYEES
jgi:hypothetical protein